MTRTARSRVAQAVPLLVGAALLSLAGGCGTKDGRPTVTIYTSIYEHVIAQLGPVLRREFPDIDVRWYQKGSEEVAAKLNSEILAGRVGADIVMTSDPFWYEELKQGGHLLPYQPEGAAGIPDELKDPDGMFVTVRVPVMVLCAGRMAGGPDFHPVSFKALADPFWRGRVTMADPNRSGSSFTAVAALARRYGWGYFEALRQNDVLVAGGNSSVLSRVVTGEKQVGIILLENLLQAKRDNPNIPVEVVYPEDGSILIPSPIAILSTTAAPDAARRVYDFLLSVPGQTAIVGGWMYSPFGVVPPPPGARPWRAVYDRALVPWSAAYLRDTQARREAIKRQFNRIMLE